MGYLNYFNLPPFYSFVDTYETEETFTDDEDDKVKELKSMRFSYRLTAFDIDIDELEEHPWRQV